MADKYREFKLTTFDVPSDVLYTDIVEWYNSLKNTKLTNLTPSSEYNNIPNYNNNLANLRIFFNDIDTHAANCISILRNVELLSAGKNAFMLDDQRRVCNPTNEENNANKP